MTDLTNSFQKVVPDFSLVLGGPLYQLWRRTRITDNTLDLLYRRIAVIVAVCWIPLFILSAVQDQLVDSQLGLPFFKDVEVHVRFLLVVPLLIAAELVVHSRMRLLVPQFLERNLIAPRDERRFQAAIHSAMKLRNSVAVEALLIVLVYAVGVAIIWRSYIALDTDSWYSVQDSGALKPSLAGMWYGLVSVPIFQFLLVRWYFRIFVWARFLWQVSKIDLCLVPTHPDRAGGLGFLSATVYAFIPLLVAHGAMLAGLIAGRIFQRGNLLTDFKLELVIVVAFLVCLVQGPLLFFVPQLAAAKRVGKREYGTLAQTYTRAFEQKWLRDTPPKDESFMGSADIQSLADLGNSYEVVQLMRPTLTTKETVLTLAGAVVLPVVPLALTMMSAEDLLKKLFGILF